MTRKTRHGSPDGVVPDMDLWEKIAKAVEPLRARPAPPSERSPPHSPAKQPRLATGPSPVRTAAPREPPLLTGLDRRTTQRLTRGQIEYDSKLDLHGSGVGEARLKLASFLHMARARGDRLVLIVTGKGASPFARHTLHGDAHYHAPERQGRLRRLVSEWLHEAEFREHVLGFQPAHPKHGGGGAYYVRLRRSGSVRQ